MDAILRDYDKPRDRSSVQRIWIECGWLEPDQRDYADGYIDAGRAHVGELNGEAECLVISAPGVVRYLDTDMPAGCITGVATSHVARRQGLASRLTARAIAADAAAGACVSVLMMFDQGFYDRLGFGTLGYTVHAAFNPADIRCSVRCRPPVRLTVEDWEAMLAARLSRVRGHGSCSILATSCMRADLMGAKQAFGLGYTTGGALSHYVWIVTDSFNRGPYSVHLMVYQHYDQFLELMALLASLSDQVHLVRMAEPPGIQLQDLLDRPWRQQTMTKNSRFEQKFEARANCQIRMNDLHACLAATHLRTDTLKFNLRVTDPIESLLEPCSAWCGVAGDYVITLGPQSTARRGKGATLPVLEATVNAFTRLWLGVRPASALAATDQLNGPPELLRELDSVLALPPALLDWDF